MFCADEYSSACRRLVYATTYAREKRRSYQRRWNIAADTRDVCEGDMRSPKHTDIERCWSGKRDSLTASSHIRAESKNSRLMLEVLSICGPS